MKIIARKIARILTRDSGPDFV